MSVDATVGRASAARGAVLVPFRAVALLTAGLILVQAALAGQWMFANQVEAIGLHGWLGNLAFLGAILLAVLAFLGLRRNGWGRAEFVLAVVLIGLMTAQLGLGYAGRQSNAAASLHIPNGVLLTMVAAALVALAWAPAPRQSGRV